MTPRRHRRRRSPSSRVEGASVTALAPMSLATVAATKLFLAYASCTGNAGARLFRARRQVVQASAPVPFIQSGGCVGHRQYQRQCWLDFLCLRVLLKCWCLLRACRQVVRANDLQPVAKLLPWIPLDMDRSTEKCAVLFDASPVG